MCERKTELNAEKVSASALGSLGQRFPGTLPEMQTHLAAEKHSLREWAQYTESGRRLISRWKRMVVWQVLWMSYGVLRNEICFEDKPDRIANRKFRSSKELVM